MSNSNGVTDTATHAAAKELVAAANVMLGLNPTQPGIGSAYAALFIAATRCEAQLRRAEGLEAKPEPPPEPKPVTELEAALEVVMSRHALAAAVKRFERSYGALENSEKAHGCAVSGG